ncbi:MAG: hypothetical protein ACI85I_000383, partial [Arenicella sp.]
MAATLPRMVWMRKVKIDIELLGNELMAGELLSIIRC